MEAQRYSAVSIYSQKGGKNISVYSPKKSNSYSPKGSDESTSIKKLLKANRMLQKELEETKSKLKEVTHQLNSEKKKTKQLNL